MLTHPLEGEGVDSPSLYLCFFFCLYMFSSQFVPIHFTFALSPPPPPPPPPFHQCMYSCSFCLLLSCSYRFLDMLLVAYSSSLFHLSLFFFCSTCPLHYFALGTYSSPVFSLSLSIYSLYVSICISSCVKKVVKSSTSVKAVIPRFKNRLLCYIRVKVLHIRINREGIKRILKVKVYTASIILLDHWRINMQHFSVAAGQSGANLDLNSYNS